jgi:hypothetical protein
MIDESMTCDALEALVPDYLEGALDMPTRVAVRVHLDSCESCRELVSDLTRITREAGSLPDLVPPTDLWEGIAARIEAPVIELAQPAAPTRQHVKWNRMRLVAAAAALVITTATGTYVATRSMSTGGAPAGGTPVTVAANPTSTPSQSGATVLPTGPATTVRNAAGGASLKKLPADRVYAAEIDQLHVLVDQHRKDLDSTTVAVLERSLRVIDTAIAQSRAALAKDPKSRFLNDRLNAALDKKVELLRTVALISARS